MGFTLVELLVVIAIIGILASIIMPSLSTARAKGRDAQRISDIKQLQLAIELYYDACGNYPTNLYTIGANNNWCNGVAVSTGLVAGGYIAVVPQDPSSSAACTADGNPGCYTYTSFCNASNPNAPIGYHLGTSLETSNAALGSDVDAAKGAGGTVCTGSSPDFSGLSYSPGGSLCNGTAGTPYPGTPNTETCFDVTN